jgi:hypothetical protein
MKYILLIIITSLISIGCATPYQNTYTESSYENVSDFGTDYLIRFDLLMKSAEESILIIFECGNSHEQEDKDAVLADISRNWDIRAELVGKVKLYNLAYEQKLGSYMKYYLHEMYTIDRIFTEKVINLYYDAKKIIVVNKCNSDFTLAESSFHAAVHK